MTGYVVFTVVIAAAWSSSVVADRAQRLWARNRAPCATTKLLSQRSGATPCGSRSGCSRSPPALPASRARIYAHYFRFVAPEQFEVLQSAAMLTMVVVGGMRTIWGPVIGAMLLQTLPQAITFLNLPPSILGPLQGLMFTGLVLLFMFFRPSGLISAPAIWKGDNSACGRRGRRSCPQCLNSRT